MATSTLSDEALLYLQECELRLQEYREACGTGTRAENRTFARWQGACRALFEVLRTEDRVRRGA